MAEDIKEVAAPEPQSLPEDYREYKAARDAAEREPASEVEASAAVVADSPAAPETVSESEPEPGKGTEREQDRDELGKFKAKEPDVPAGVQKRIDKAVAKQREAERRTAEMERRLAELSRVPAPEQVKAEPPATEPQADQFDTYEAYTRALARWEAKAEARQFVEAEFSRVREEHQRQLAEQGESRARQSWQGQVEEGRKRYEDFDEVMEAPAPITPVIRQLILTSEHGADLAYYLGKHPEDCQRLAELHPVAAGRELGRLEAQLTAVLSKPAPEPTKPAVSKAPKPPTPVGASASPTSTSVYDEKLADNYPAWRKARERELASR